MIRKLFVLSLLMGALSWVGACDDDDTTTTDAGSDVAIDSSTDSSVTDGNVGDADLTDAN